MAAASKTYKGVVVKIMGDTGYIRPTESLKRVSSNQTVYFKTRNVEGGSVGEGDSVEFTLKVFKQDKPFAPKVKLVEAWYNTETYRGQITKKAATTSDGLIQPLAPLPEGFGSKDVVAFASNVCMGAININDIVFFRLESNSSASPKAQWVKLAGDSKRQPEKRKESQESGLYTTSVQEGIHMGVVKMIKLRFGFIRPRRSLPGGHNSIYFNTGDIEGASLSEGDSVQFTVEDIDDEKPAADWVTLHEELNVPGCFRGRILEVKKDVGIIEPLVPLPEGFRSREGVCCPFTVCTGRIKKNDRVYFRLEPKRYENPAAQWVKLDE